MISQRVGHDADRKRRKMALCAGCEAMRTIGGREGCIQEQDCLSHRYQVIITNSPPTGSDWNLIARLHMEWVRVITFRFSTHYAWTFIDEKVYKSGSVISVCLTWRRTSLFKEVCAW